MVDLEPITERAAFHGASAITVEDMTSEFPVHSPGSASQIERFVLGETDQVHIPIAEDLCESARSQSRTGKDGNATFAAGFLRSSGVDDHCHIDTVGGFFARNALIGGFFARNALIQGVLTDGDQGQSPPFRHRQTLIFRDDLIGPLVDRLLHDPGIQTGELTPKRCGQLIGMTEMDKTIPGSPFTIPGQPLVISHQPTQPRNVITLMTGTGFRGKPRKLFRPIKGDLTSR